jgi:hypothetical protein
MNDDSKGLGRTPNSVQTGFLQMLQMMKIVTRIGRSDSLLKAEILQKAMFKNRSFSRLVTHEQEILPVFQQEGETTWLVLLTF